MKARGRLLGALVTGALVTGCGKTTAVTTDAGATVPAEAAASAEPLPMADAPLRRPTRRYFFDHTETRCEVYSVDGDSKTTPAEFACPSDLNVGERLRIVGKTCTRESPEPERREPVVCPDPVTNLEKSDLAREHPPL
jgi:hypothetical protein